MRVLAFEYSPKKYLHMTKNRRFLNKMLFKIALSLFLISSLLLTNFEARVLIKKESMAMIGTHVINYPQQQLCYQKFI